MIPNPEVLLALEPEELAGVVLEYLNSFDARDGSPNRTNFANSVQEYPERREEIAQALTEAWVWLEREGLIAPKPGEIGGGWVFVTRRGKRIQTAEQLKSYRHANVLPKNQIHPVIAQKVWSTFIRGDYDTAVFQSFKEVEVAVRDAGKFTPKDLGVDLMRKAFHPKRGPLTDMSTPEGEREALQHLFAGSIGTFKNPQSHTHVAIDNPHEAAEIITIASYLLRIVDSRITG